MFLRQLPSFQQKEIGKQLSEYETDTERYVRDLHEFVKSAWHIVEPNAFIDNWHIGAICEHLQAVTSGQIKKLLINVPPGCSKSLLCSVLWFGWEWAKDPTIRWLFASYDQLLALRDSVRCRKLIRSAWYRDQWPIDLMEDQNKKIQYENEKGGWRMATTPGGHGVGEHPHRVVVDDPNNVKQAESEVERQSTNDWWDLTMTMRGLALDVRSVGIMQRLHEEDWSGHVLLEGDWTHLCLPMYYEKDRMKTTILGWNDPRKEEGELLSPNYLDREKLKVAEKRLGLYGSAGQLQQRPAPREGGMFRLDSFKIIDALPANMRKFVRGWDKAGSEATGDYTAGVLAGEHEGNIYFIDLVHGQWNSGRRDSNIEVAAGFDFENYGTVEIWIEREPGSGGKESGELTVTRLRGWRAHLETACASSNKLLWADSLASQCDVGNVYMLRGSWNQSFIREMIAFPNASHDDIVAAASLAFMKLSKPRLRVMVA